MGWIRGYVPTHWESAIITADVLGLSAVVSRFASIGPPVVPIDRVLKNHELRGNDVVVAWAKGYKLEFDGYVDFPVDLRALHQAIVVGMPVIGLLAGPGVTDGIVSMCPGLKVLYAPNNPDVTCCPPSVEDLDASGSCGISDVSSCKNLWRLQAGGNLKIQTVPLTVERLYLVGSSCSFDLRGYIGLKVLCASGNPSIKTCPIGLIELDASGDCGISSISHCRGLRKLIATGNPKIRLYPESVTEAIGCDVSLQKSPEKVIIENSAVVREAIRLIGGNSQEAMPNVLKAMGITVSVDTFANWINGGEITNARAALDAGLTAGIPSLVTRTMRAAGPVTECKPITDHTLTIEEVLKAWMKGYRPVFDRMIDAHACGAQELLDAMRRGFRPKKLTLGSTIPNAYFEDIKPFCDAVEEFHIINSPRIKSCPPNLKVLRIVGDTGIDTKRNWIPLSVEKLTLIGPELPTNMQDHKSLKYIEVKELTRKTTFPASLETLITSNCTVELGESLMVCKSMKTLVVPGVPSNFWIPLEVTKLDISRGKCSRICSCDNLKELIAVDNEYIRDYPQSVEILDISGKCGIRYVMTNACLNTLIMRNRHPIVVPPGAMKIIT